MIDDEPKAVQPEPVEVRGVTQRDFQQWRHNPVTQWFLAYLAEYRADLVTAASESWLAGDLKLSTEDEMKGRVNALGEIATLPFSAVAEFYQQMDAAAAQKTDNAPEQEEDDGSEAAKDDAG